MLEFEHQLLIAAGLAGLALKRADLPLHFPDEIGDANQVLLGVFELTERFPFLAFEFGDAGRLLENQAAVLGLAGKNLSDVTLGHDAVTGAAHTRAHEQHLNVLQSAWDLVDEILAGAIPENPACDGNLVEKNVRAGRSQVLVIHTPQRQRHLRHAQRLPPIRPVEDDVRHLAATQRLCRLLPQYPSNSVGHVGLTTTVGANNRRHPGLKVERSLVCEGLKA